MSTFTVYLVSPPGYGHSMALAEAAEATAAALRDLGHESTLTTDPTRLSGRTIVFGPQLLNMVPEVTATLDPTTVLYNLEQVEPGSPWMNDSVMQLYRRFPVWDYSEQNADRLRSLGVCDVAVVPIGHHPCLERIPDAVEDIDVLFYGSLNERRATVLHELVERGASVHHAFGVYGSARDDLIARSRMVLNLHYYDAKVFEIVRVSYLLANGRFVVSETGQDPAIETPLADGIAFGAYDELATMCLHYLDDPEARARIAARGQALIRQAPLVDHLDRALSDEPARVGAGNLS